MNQLQLINKLKLVGELKVIRRSPLNRSISNFNWRLQSIPFFFWFKFEFGHSEEKSAPESLGGQRKTRRTSRCGKRMKKNRIKIKKKRERAAKKKEAKGEVKRKKRKRERKGKERWRSSQATPLFSARCVWMDAGATLAPPIRRRLAYRFLSG